VHIWAVALLDGISKAGGDTVHRSNWHIFTTLGKCNSDLHYWVPAVISDLFSTSIDPLCLESSIKN
jgi:hypothetical protein